MATDFFERNSLTVSKNFSSCFDFVFEEDFFFGTFGFAIFSGAASSLTSILFSSITGSSFFPPNFKNFLSSTISFSGSFIATTS